MRAVGPDPRSVDELPPVIAVFFLTPGDFMLGVAPYCPWTLKISVSLIAAVNTSARAAAPLYAANEAAGIFEIPWNVCTFEPPCGPADTRTPSALPDAPGSRATETPRL